MRGRLRRRAPASREPPSRGQPLASPTQQVEEPIHELDLTSDELDACLIAADPCRSVDLGELPLPARASRPLHREGVATDVLGVEVPLAGEGEDPFAACVPDLTERGELD